LLAVKGFSDRFLTVKIESAGQQSRVASKETRTPIDESTLPQAAAFKQQHGRGWLCGWGAIKMLVNLVV